MQGLLYLLHNFIIVSELWHLPCYNTVIREREM